VTSAPTRILRDRLTVYASAPVARRLTHPYPSIEGF
jgi:hypothetical protein